MMNDAKFLPLREMESFTEDMFNRIIAFQEKEHPAWNMQLGFDERIKGLPLHNFIFSNPDRDPAKSGPTLAHYYPLRSEFQKLAHYINQTGASAQVCDVYPGNGIIGSLLAREGVKVFGLKREDVYPCQISEFYDPRCYRFVDTNLQEADCNTIFASWVPSDINPTPEFLQKNPDLIIYVFTDYIDASSNRRQVGSVDMFDDLPGAGYHLVDQWSITRPKDILHEIWPDMTPCIEETRHTHIYAADRIGELQALPEQSSIESGYDWETELFMTHLALEAKHLIECGKMPLPG